MQNNDEISPEIETNVIVLAGGNSSRMEYPKVWLPFGEEQTILEHIVSEYNAIGCKKIVVVLNKSFIEGYSELINRLEENVIVVRNENPNKGRIYSLKLGIKYFLSPESFRERGQTGNKAGHTFIHNVDNPFASYLTLTALLKQHFFDYARPVYNERGGHPILVSNGILEGILRADDNEILRDLLSAQKGVNVDIKDESVLCNINTPEDYARHFGKHIEEFLSAELTEENKNEYRHLRKTLRPRSFYRSANDITGKRKLT